MTNPRFGFDNIFNLFKSGVICTNPDPDKPFSNAYDWRPSTLWSPPWKRSLVNNGDLLLWSGGGSAAPDGFILSGAGASVTRISSDAPEFFPYAARVTRAGANAILYQPIDGGDPQSMIGLKVIVAGYAKASSPNQARVRITDGPTASAGVHTGGGGWELLVSAPLTITQAVTQVQAAFDVITTDGDVEFAGMVALVYSFDEAVPASYYESSSSALYVFPAEGQEMRNWVYDEWSQGGAQLPDGWSEILGTITQAYRSPSAKVGRYAMELNASDAAVGQEVTGEALQEMLGSRVWHGHWCNTGTGGSRARVAFVYRLRNGDLSLEVAGTPGAGGRSHSGGSSYEWLATYVDVPNDVLGVIPVVIQDDSGGDFVATWSGGLLVTQDAEPDPTPHPQGVDYVAFANHTMGSSGASFSVDGSDDNFATNSAVISDTPGTDKTLWRDLEPAPGGPGPSFHGAFRLLIPPNPNPKSCPVEIGALSAGLMFQLPCAPLAPFRSLNEGFVSDTPLTRGGFPLGRSISRLFSKFEMVFQLFYRQFVVDELYGIWWQHAGGISGKPWFLQWNDGDYPDETHFVWLPDGYVFDPNLFVGQQIRDFRIDLEGLAR